jgi:RNA polymerase sigma-70 factor (ECF subfamily)
MEKYTSKISEDISEAFSAFFKELCRFAASRIEDTEEAKDIVAGVFARVYERDKPFENLLEMRRYLYASVLNACIDHVRDQQKQRRFVADFVGWSKGDEVTIGSFASVLKEKQLEAVENAYLKLPPRTKEVVHLINVGLCTETIGRCLGIAPQTVLNTKTNGLRAIRETLGLKHKIRRRLNPKNK